MKAVVADRLHFAYGSRTVLEDLSFTVETGSAFAVLGPNGSGKSTLFQILATLLRPAAGRVEILGLDPRNAAFEIRRRIGVVFQSPALDDVLTVGENLHHHGRLFGLSGNHLEQRIEAVLRDFNLSDRRRDPVRTLSGGLKRRTELAKALLPEPEVLILDEPSTGLDPVVRHELWEQLDALRLRGLTLLITTHLMDEADRASELILLDRGRLVAAGEPDALKAGIGGDVIRLTLRGEPKDVVEALATSFPELVPEVLEGEIRFEAPDAHRLVPALAQALGQSLPNRLAAISVARPTLEDVFLNLTGRRWNEAEADNEVPKTKRQRLRAGGRR